MIALNAGQRQHSKLTLNITASVTAGWDEKVPQRHPVRVLDEVIEKPDLIKLYKCYKGGRSSSYNPKMLAKAIIYAYINNIYSSRKIEEAINSNIYFIW